MPNNTDVRLQTTSYSWHILIKIEFYRYIFGKHADIKFHENPPGGTAFYADRQRADRHDEANNHFAQFYERA